MIVFISLNVQKFSYAVDIVILSIRNVIIKKVKNALKLTGTCSVITVEIKSFGAVTFWSRSRVDTHVMTIQGRTWI